MHPHIHPAKKLERRSPAPDVSIVPGIPGKKLSRDKKWRVETIYTIQRGRQAGRTVSWSRYYDTEIGARQACAAVKRQGKYDALVHAPLIVTGH